MGAEIMAMYNFIPYKPTFEGEFDKYVLITEIPTVGDILGRIEVDVQLTGEQLAKPECVFYTDGAVSFEPNINYAEERAEAYPSIQDQLDMQYHDLINGTTTWKDAIQAVKDSNPKP